jgi:hypothetical protein
MLRRNVNPEYQGSAEHAFIADHAHFQSGMAVCGRNQGNETVNGKVNVVNPLSGPGQDLGKFKLYGLAARQKLCAVSAR